MENNRYTIAAILGTALLLAVTLGITLRLSTPDVPEPVSVGDAPANPAQPGSKAKGDAGKPTATSYTATASGLKIYDQVEGTGDLPTDGNVVRIKVVTHKGANAEKKLGPRSEETFAVGEGKTLPAFDEAVRGMKPGGLRWVVAPPSLAYGYKGKPPLIGPDETLTFEIRLLEVGAPRQAPSKPTSVKKTDLNRTESGLQYAILTPGTGPRPNAGDTVVLDFTTFLDDGSKIDSSLDRTEPVQLVIGKGQALPAWDEAIVDMKVGEKRQLISPPGMAWGDKGVPGLVPAKATVTFELHLVEIKRK